MRYTIYRFGKFQLTTATRELRCDGGRVQLPRRAFDCILYLIEHRDRAVGRDELTAAVWGRVDVTDAQLSQIMLHARRAIDDSGQAQHTIRTLAGFGYHWIADTDKRSEGYEELVANPPKGVVVQGESERISSVASETVSSGAAAENTSVSPSPALPEQDIAVMRPPARQYQLAAGSAILIVLACVVAALALSRLRAPVISPRPETSASTVALAILPLEVIGSSDSGWIRLGAMDLIAEHLRNAGLAVPPSESVLFALRGANEPRDGGRQLELGNNLGVGTLVQGKAIRSPEGWTIELAADRGKTQHYTATAKDADVIRAAHQASDLLLAAMGHAPPIRHAESNNLEEQLQQAHAAMLAGELDTARTILAAIPEHGAPEVKLAQAMVDARSGRLDQAETAYTELVATPAVSSEPLLYGRALSYRGAVHGRRMEFAAAERDYDAAVTALQRTHSSIDLARALNGRGVSRLALDRFDDAAVDLGRARIELQRAPDRFGLIQSDTNFGLLEARRDRLEQALPYLLGAADRFEAFGAVERMLAVLTSAFDAEAALLHWPKALAIAERQWARIDKAGDPGLRLQIAVNRGTALVAKGGLREAQDLLDQTEREHGATRDQARRYLHALRAEIAWNRGLPKEAVAAADKAIALWPDDDPGDDLRARLLLLRQRALISAGDAGTAAFERAPDSPSARKPSPTRLVALAEMAAWKGRSNDAEHAFRDALAASEVRGVPADLALVAQAYGYWLMGQMRVDEASALAGRIAPWAEQDFNCAVFQAAVLKARGDHKALAAILPQVRTLAGEREIPSILFTVAAE